MLVPRSVRLLLLAATALGSTPTFASQPSAATPAATAGRRVYTPADFARFAPKTAYDMLVQVQSFTIRSADTT